MVFVQHHHHCGLMALLVHLNLLLLLLLNTQIAPTYSYQHLRLMKFLVRYREDSSTLAIFDTHHMRHCRFCALLGVSRLKQVIALTNTAIIRLECCSRLAIALGHVPQEEV